MSLTDFLLARNAEKETEARRLLVAFRNDLFIGCDLAGGEPPLTVGEYDARRILAECEAVRRIVELATMTERPQRLMDRLTFPTANAALNPALRLLAAVYADHPDYRQEWRP